VVVVVAAAVVAGGGTGGGREGGREGEMVGVEKEKEGIKSTPLSITPAPPPGS